MLKGVWFTERVPVTVIIINLFDFEYNERDHQRGEGASDGCGQVHPTSSVKQQTPSDQHTVASESAQQLIDVYKSQ